MRRTAAACANRLLRRLASPYVLCLALVAIYLALVVVIPTVARTQSTDQIRSWFAAADVNPS